MLQLRRQRNQKGFTLVEIAIVLVIVGLVLFAVMKGGDMVKAGKAKKTIDQMEQLRAAILSYSNQHGGQLPSTADALKELADAKIISYNKPPGMFNGYGSEVTAKYVAADKDVEVLSPGIPDYIALQMDQTLDDGLYNKGEIQAAAVYKSIATPDDETPTDITMKVK
jgi:prepilin-type N-terminal cleavage/methylation domain-containing protein